MVGAIIDVINPSGLRCVADDPINLCLWYQPCSYHYRTTKCMDIIMPGLNLLMQLLKSWTERSTATCWMTVTQIECRNTISESERLNIPELVLKRNDSCELYIQQKLQRTVCRPIQSKININVHVNEMRVNDSEMIMR